MRQSEELFSCFPIRPRLILLRNYARGHLGPVDLERGIIPAHSTRRLSIKVLTHHIEDLCRIREGLKSMSAPLCDIQRTAIFSIQLRRDPLQICRGVVAQVDRDIVQGSLRAADQLRFRMRFLLIVHATERARALIERSTALHHTSLEASFNSLFFVPRPCKKTTFILKEIKLHNIHTGDLG